MPPERGTSTPSFSYDLYSFAVICIVGMTGRIPSENKDILSEFETLDLPPEISEQVRSCLASDPSGRPESAGVLLANLSAMQHKRERRRESETEVFLDIPSNVAEVVEQVLGLTSGTGADFIIDDLSGIAGFAYDGRIEEAPDLQIAGEGIYISHTTASDTVWLALCHAGYSASGTSARGRKG